MRSDSKASSAGSTSSQGRPRLLISLCLAFAGLLALCASTALAAQTHPYTGTSFGPDGVGGSASFERVQSLAVDPANGDTYVYDGAAGKVYKFNASGAPVNFSATGTNAISGVGGGGGGAEFEIALAPAGSPGGTAGDIYVANNGQAIHVYSPAGAELGELGQGGETCGIATDPSGNFYAGVFSSTINKYTPSANPPEETDKVGIGTAEVGLCNVAADGLGNVYAANFSAGVYKLEGLGDASPTLIDSGANTMAVAPGSNDLYADRGNEVFQYDSTGTPIGSFGAEAIAGSHGVAVNAGATKIYVGTPAKVKVFGAAVVVPDVSADAPTEVHRTSAVLNGTIGAAGGPAATCEFEYVTRAQFEAEGFSGAGTAPCAPAGPFTGTGQQPVSAAISGLNVETSYRFRLTGINEDGTNYGQVQAFTTLGPVNVAIGEASNVSIGGATLNGTINPEGLPIEECLFRYGTEFAFNHTVPCAESSGEVGSGSVGVDVHADISGLDSATQYQFQLVGKNSLGQSTSASSSFVTRGPGVTGTSVSAVAADGVTLQGTVNPNNEETTYFFEYVSEADFAAGEWASATKAPVSGGTIEAGAGTTQVSELITGLAPRTTYHFRLLAQTLVGTSVSNDRTFTTFGTGGGTGLPDGRAYEQATPVEKNGNSVQGAANFVQASSIGARISYYVGGGIPGGTGASDLPLYMSNRVGGAWNTRGLLPPSATGPRGAVRGWSEDLAHVYTSNFFLSPPVTASIFDLDSDSGALRTLASGVTTLRPFYVGGSSDASVIAFEKNEPVGTVAVWDENDGAMINAGVLNDGSLPEEGAAAGPYDWYGSATAQPGSAGGYYTQADHALSADGSRLFFTALGSLQLYLRENLTGSQSPLGPGEECTDPTAACTVQVSASQAATPDPNGERPAIFAGATPDGSSVFFMSQGKLTDNATTGLGDEGRDLYRFNADSGVLTDLTPDSTDPNGAEVFGVVGYSDDGSHVYFVANGDLAAGASAGSCGGEFGIGTRGECSLYEWHGGTITFIARLKLEGEQGDGINFQATSTTEKVPTGQVSSDGATLLFSSVRQLTAFDNEGLPQLYRYESASGEIDCVSCDSTGAPAVRASVTAQSPPNLSPIATAAVKKRNLSADGKRIFFDTVARLLPTDTNGVNDVYEWEANGSGSCRGEDENGGCLYLISSGTGVLPSYFADASENGNDVFFFTAQSLVGQDRDALVDIYDARVGGGIPSQNPPLPNPCAGEACRGPVPPAPTTASAGTATFSGPPNSKQHRSHPKKKHRKKHKRAGKHRAAHRQEGSH